MIDWSLVLSGIIGSISYIWWDNQERKRKCLEDKIDEIQYKLDEICSKTNLALNLCKNQTKFFNIT